MIRRIASYPLKGVEKHLDEHMKLVLSSVELLQDLSDACRRYDWEAVGSTAEKIANVERTADDVKRNVELGLYSGRIFTGLKEDFVRLADSVDMIADRSKEVSRMLALRVPEKEAVDLLFSGKVDLKAMVSGTIEIVKLLESSIETMSIDMKAALNMAHDVEKMEEKLDDIKLELLRYLTANERSLKSLSYLQIRDFIFSLDLVADAAEDASDVVTSMIVKTGA
jgi:predicted phosphate transport protein (TIGR00153 family)